MFWVFALGVVVGWFTLLLVSVIVSVCLIRNPPETILRAIGKNMARQATKSIRKTAV